jgi:hypothetical protein
MMSMRKVTEESARKNIRPERAGGAWYLDYADTLIESSVSTTGIGKRHQKGSRRVNKRQQLV